MGARGLIEAVVDQGSFRSWDEPLDQSGFDESYRRQLESARQRAGTDEAVLTGEGTVDGRRVAVVACEFEFMAGSFGRKAAGRLAAAVARATAEGLALLASPASGGTRMQEGTPAFVEMVRITAAVARHKEHRLPYLVYLRHPTTGGVLASWGSLGHVTVAEPGALIGFLGPRVYEGLYRRPFPTGVQTAENLVARGVIDAVAGVGELRGLLIRTLDALTGGRALPEPGRQNAEPEPGPEVGPEPEAAVGSSLNRTQPTPVDAWTAVTRSRSPDRPGVRRFLRVAASDVIPLNGTGAGEAGPGLLLAMARFGDVSCVVIGQDRRGQAEVARLGPGALRTARRGMSLAVDLGLPLLTVIDTSGAELSAAAEEGGLAGEIARCLAELVGLQTHTVSALLGEGCGGAALALLPGDRVVAAQHGWLAPLPPEGASLIAHRSVDRAAEMARQQRITAPQLFEDGVVDDVVPELPDAAVEPDEFCRRLGEAVQHELVSLTARALPVVLAVRRSRYGAGVGVWT